MATPVVENLDINIAHVQELLQDCMDIVQQEIYLRAGRVFLVYGETTISNVLLDQSVIAELLHQLDTLSVEEQRILLTKKGITAGKSKQFATIEEALCVLFTGDILTDTEKKLLPELEDVDFLKVGHHGSRYSTCQEFLDVVRPELAVVSCSATNTYGHPSGETIERLEDSGAKIWYSMKEGAVTAESDGKDVWLDTFVHP